MQRTLDQIDSKCVELGLKININKTKAMAIKHKQNPRSLTLQANSIEWVTHFTYLGVIITQDLSPQKQIQHLKQVTKMRENALRKMTSLQQGATYHLLRTFYVQTIRAQVEYAAPILSNIPNHLAKSLEVIQNNCLRLILGAPMWVRICVLQTETQLPPLKSRIDQRNTGIICKTFLQNRTGPLNSKLRACLNLHPNLDPPATQAGNLLNTLRRLDMQETLMGITPDTPPDNFRMPPPWHSNPLHINYTKLLQSKSQCTITQMQQAARAAIQHTAANNTYYTDGSLDTNVPAAAAAVVSNSMRGGWRLSGNASTLQTELIAIEKALEDSISKQGSTTIHTDSKGATQALSTLKPKQNINMINRIFALAIEHKEQGRRVTINWIPSHIDIMGNEEADTLAKNTLSCNTVNIKISPSLTQLKKMAKGQQEQQRQTEIALALQDNSETTRWYVETTKSRPHNITKETSRRLAVIIHRLRIGYRCTWQRILNEQDGPRPCNYCEELDDHPLEHYLLRCPNTAILRENLEEENLSAQSLTSDILDNIDNFAGFLTSYPPPR